MSERRLWPGEGRLLLPGNKGKKKGNCPKIQKGRFKLDITIYFFSTEKFVRHRKRLPKEEVESSSLELLINQVDMALEDTV